MSDPTEDYFAPQDGDRSERETAMLKRHVAQLAEHFESVLIITTRHDPGQAGGTVMVRETAGNYYANYAACREWITRCDEITRDNIRSRPGD